MSGEKDVEDFEMIFEIFDEGIFMNISKEKSSKDSPDFLSHIADRLLSQT